MSSSTAEAQALALFQSGRLAEAESALQAILAATPDAAGALHILGCVYAQGGRAAEGLALIDRSIARDPRNASFLGNRARLLAAAGRSDEAVRDLRRAVQIEPGFGAAFFQLGNLLLEAGRDDEALAAFRRAAALEPRNADALNSLGYCLQKAGRLDEALAHYARAVDARPGFAAALVNWGNALNDRGDLAGAKAMYGKAMAAQGPGVAEAFSNAASIAVDQGLLEEARRNYEHAAELRPDYADPRYGLATLQLREQRFAQGWDGYELRFETSPPQATRRGPPLPVLDAARLASARRVAVWLEQGVGDQILFSTLLPELRAAGVGAVVEVDPRLAGIYRRSLPSLEFTTPGESAPAFAGCDAQIALGSLPRLFRPGVASFARQPRALLIPDAIRVERMRAALGPGRWIAISWRSFQGGERRALAARKSIPLEEFAQIAQASGERLLDLQYGDVSEERTAFEARHPGMLRRLDGLDTFNDFEGVLAAIEACERVVTASNVTAHLAGAIGKATSLLLAAATPPFHYWVPGAGGRSLWYPSVEIVPRIS
jgi:tetratricopeptide (TPR) repeat protein